MIRRFGQINSNMYVKGSSIALRRITLRRPEEQVFDDLHRDRTGASQPAASGVLDRILDGLVVDAIVFAEAGVFAHQHGTDHVRRHVLKIYPLVETPLARDPALQHQGRNRRIDKSVGNDQQQHERQPSRQQWRLRS